MEKRSKKEKVSLSTVMILFLVFLVGFMLMYKVYSIKTNDFLYAPWWFRIVVIGFGLMPIICLIAFAIAKEITLHEMIMAWTFSQMFCGMIYGGAVLKDLGGVLVCGFAIPLGGIFVEIILIIVLIAFFNVDIEDIGF